MPELPLLDGGWFRMGSADPYADEEDGEGPVRQVRVDPCRLAAHCVSNREFAEFAAATGHVTAAGAFRYVVRVNASVSWRPASPSSSTG